MPKKFKKVLEQEKRLSKIPKDQSVKRFWGNATRLENRNVSGKKSK